MNLVTVVVLIVLATCLSTGVLFTSFAAVASFRKLYDDDRLWNETPPAMKLTALGVGALGLLADVVFNWTRGAMIYRESPWAHRTLMFTHRTQWHLDHSQSWRRVEAERWASLGNAIMPGHFKL